MKPSLIAAVDGKLRVKALLHDGSAESVDNVPDLPYILKNIDKLLSSINGVGFD